MNDLRREDLPSQVLLLHEEHKSRQVLRDIMEQKSFVVNEADDFVDANRRLRAEKVELLIVSSNLKCADIKKEIHDIKAGYGELPVILVTREKRIQAMKECATLGGDGVITYPLNYRNVSHSIFLTLISLRNKSVEEREVRINSIPQLVGYSIKGILGTGMMGVVYLAEKIDDSGNSTKKGRQYALKLIHNHDHWSDQKKRDNLERFIREAHVIASIRHPNIVEVHDYGIDEEQGIPYLVMDYVQGQSLRKFIKSQILNYQQNAKIIRQVAYALNSIHSRNIYHRDIKPENIILDVNLNVKVSDFGTARLPNSKLTQNGTVLGTPSYIAPEVLSSNKVDHRVDLFSLGVVAYELFVGINPFDAPSLTQIREKVIMSNPLDPAKISPDFPEELRSILGKLLKKDPKQRYNSAAEVVLDIDEYLESTAINLESSASNIVGSFEPDSLQLSKRHFPKINLCNSGDWN